MRHCLAPTLTVFGPVVVPVAKRLANSEPVVLPAVPGSVPEACGPSHRAFPMHTLQWLAGAHPRKNGFWEYPELTGCQKSAGPTTRLEPQIHQTGGWYERR